MPKATTVNQALVHTSAIFFIEIEPEILVRSRAVLYFQVGSGAGWCSGERQAVVVPCVVLVVISSTRCSLVEGFPQWIQLKGRLFALVTNDNSKQVLEATAVDSNESGRYNEIYIVHID